MADNTEVFTHSIGVSIVRLSAAPIGSVPPNHPVVGDPHPEVAGLHGMLPAIAGRT
jgi:hypothetical protein